MSEAAEVLQLGDPRLRRPSLPVGDVRERGFVDDARRLEATLAAFRVEHGFGRAISAPQIGVCRRFIALDVGRGPELIVDPVITWRSDETFTLWDDCMSFPALLVRVRRHASISVAFRDRDGAARQWQDLSRSMSELLQHEIDHLDGTLAVDRAIDRSSLITRQAFERDREHFMALVDGVGGDGGAS